MQNADFLEYCEYYNAFGFFLVIVVACIINVILAGIPLWGVMSVILETAFWTLVMFKVAQPSAMILQHKRAGTILPQIFLRTLVYMCTSQFDAGGMFPDHCTITTTNLNFFMYTNSHLPPPTTLFDLVICFLVEMCYLCDQMARKTVVKGR
jgi:hypothetical protein